MADINKFTDLLAVISDIGITVTEKTRQFLKALDERILITDSEQLLETDDGLFDIAPNGDLHRISIFINQRNSRNNPRDESEVDWHKFHLYRCHTIRNYPVSRKHRYKKTNNTEGLFKYIITYNNYEYKKADRIKSYCQKWCFSV